jgi:cobalamin biosynthesis protein CobD/CbiB
MPTETIFRDLSLALAVGVWGYKDDYHLQLPAYFLHFCLFFFALPKDWINRQFQKYDSEENQWVRQSGTCTRSPTRAVTWLQWLYKNMVDITFILLLINAAINMILLFVGKYEANARAIIDILMYFSNALAHTYFVLVGIALRALGPPAHSEGSSGCTHSDEDERVEPHCRWKQCVFVAAVILGACVILSIYFIDCIDLLLRKQAVWLIWVLLFAICLKARAMSETVKMLASDLESRVVANLYFISFG